MKDDDLCDELTFSGIFKKYSKELYQYFYYRYGGDCNIEDFIQDAYTKLWHKCSQVTASKVRAYLYTSVRNMILNDMAHKKVVLKYQQQSKHIETSSYHPSYFEEDNMYVKQLQKALESLSEEQRVTFLLNRIEGKKFKEIAEIMGISPKAVEKRVYTAFKKIKKQISNDN